MKLKEIEILDTDDNGLHSQLLDFWDDCYDNGLSEKQNKKIAKEISDKNGFVYEFNFWKNVLERCGCELYDNTVIVVHKEDKNENRFFIDSDLEGLWFVLIGKQYRIESKKYKYDEIFTICDKFEIYQKLFFKLVKLQKIKK